MNERINDFLQKFGFPIALCLTALGYCAFQSRDMDDAVERAKRIGSNVVAEQVPNVEKLGFAGASGLDIANDLEAGYAIFTRDIAASGAVVFVEEDALSRDPVYARLLAALPAGDALKRVQMENLGSGSNRRVRQQVSGAQRAAITFFGYGNGLTRPPIVKRGHDLARLTEQEARELAASLRVRYLVAVGVFPIITAYEPGNMAGYVVVTHRVRVRDASGAVILDAHSSMDLFKAAAGGYPMIDQNLTQEQRTQMGQSRLALLFPTDEQRAQIAAVERRLVTEGTAARARIAAQEVVGLFH